MMLWTVFWEFLKIGCFSFGGGYGAIPLIRDTVISRGWADEEMLGNIIAISESTPGPIMVNAATYIGGRQAGVAGAALATVGVVLPAFAIMLLVAAFLRVWLKKRGVQAAFQGIRPCLMGVILSTGVCMAFTAVLGEWNAPVFQPVSLVLLLILVAVSLIFWKVKKREISPITLIVAAAALGIVLYR